MYLEPLPEECPPNDAVEKEYPEVWRALPSDHVLDEHFFSKTKAGNKLPEGMDPCRFASCSLYTAHSPAAKMLKFPKFQGGAVAKLTIPGAAGRAKKKKQHVDFWAYSEFKFLDFVLEVKNGEGV